MAKKRKGKDEEEDKPFKLPKFDEEKFIKKEKKKIKSTFLAFMLGIGISVISFGFWVLLSGNDIRWPLVLLLGVITGSWLKYLFVKLNVDISDFGKKDWFGAYMIYFFTWLVVLVVIVNPPFYDDEAPKVDLIVLPDMQEPGGTVMVLAKITDNTGVKKEHITFSVDDNILPSSSYDFYDDVFRYNYISPINITSDTNHSFKLIVKDESGIETEKTGSFTISKNVISLAIPDNNSYVKAASDIKFNVNTDVWRFYYTVDNGKQINASMEQGRDDRYVTFPEYSGWPSGKTNVTVRASAKLVHNFQNHFVDGKAYWFVNYINDTSTYTFDVANESTIGSIDVNDKDWVKVDMPKPDVVSAPGFEILAFLVSLGAVVLIFKYSKKHRRN